MLSPELFHTVVASTPLVSIDLIIRNKAGDVLLGLRKNRPAQGYWFVPGGRIRKDESFHKAFYRLVQDELGCSMSIDQARFLGPYQHFYRDSIFGENVSTHYVVLAYMLEIALDINLLPVQQHQDYRWFTVDEILKSETVHQHTRDYFLNH